MPQAVAPAVVRPGGVGICRGCGAERKTTFIDLGHSASATSYLDDSQLPQAERSDPLQVCICEACMLVQLGEIEPPEAILSDYACSSSLSTTWVEHARLHRDMIVDSFGLGPQHQVIVFANNDG